jgi:hypothetical protein
MLSGSSASATAVMTLAERRQPALRDISEKTDARVISYG